MTQISNVLISRHKEEMNYEQSETLSLQIMELFEKN